MKTASLALAKASGAALQPGGENHVPDTGPIHGIAIRFGYVLCGNMATSQLNFIDPASGLIAYRLQLPPGSGPEGLRGIDSTPTRIILADTQLGNVYSIVPPLDGRPPTIEGTVTGLASPRAVRTDLDGNLWVIESISPVGAARKLNAAGIIGTVPLASVLLMTVQVGNLPYYPDIDPLTNDLYVPSQLGAELYIVNMTTGAVRTHGTGPRPYECYNAGDIMYVTEHGDGLTDGIGVLKLNLAQNGWTVRVVIGDRKDALAGIRVCGDRAYACCSGTDRLVSFDADAQDAANADIRFVTVETPGGSPETTSQHPAMLDTDGHDLWVSLVGGRRAWRLRHQIAWE